MMQLLCNGEALDLTTTSLNFTKKNILFSFEAIECERSTNFAIPATSKNNRIFGLANWAQLSGSAMRTRMQAQLVDGVVVKDGYLYITSASASVYNAVLVCGELLKLKAIKEAGKLSEFLTRAEIADTTTYDKTRTYSIDRSWSTHGYHIDDPDNDNPCFPSINFAYLFQKCCTHFGLTAAEPVVSSKSGLFLTPKSLKNSQGNDASVGDGVYLYDNLPPCTFVELIKTYANTQGKLPCIDSNGAITFESGNADSWPTIELDDIALSVGEMKRTFGDFAQVSSIKESGERIQTDYTVANTNISESKDIYKVPFDCGVERGYVEQGLYYNVINVCFGTGSEFGLSRMNDSDPYVVLQNMHTLDSSIRTIASGAPVSDNSNEFKHNTLVNTLCSKSTTFDLSVKMPLFQYENIKPKTAFLFRGLRYVWTEVQWTDGVAKITLSKV